MNFQLVLQETFVLAQRFFLQLKRRPITLISGILQPLIWLLLFANLYQKAPINFLGNETPYLEFFSPGIIVFTAFNGALNAGLPLIFDREFNFLDRLLIAPLISRFSIVFAACTFIISISLLQTVIVFVVTTFLGATLPNFLNSCLIALILLLLVLGVTAISLSLAFSLSSHIELIGLILIINLPILFTSTALVPIKFMPNWLQFTAVLNPLSYAIEAIRYLYLNSTWSFTHNLFDGIEQNIRLIDCFVILIVLDIIVLFCMNTLFKKSIS
uniref:ABC-type multidrug transport system permease component n=1 Tax=Glaucocystis incrassata TaxID=1789788 RepID=A0A3G1IVH1_9EUKA|nr:ABC-type multidrug transport system permease component [Glaucocystis incrassata]ASQ40040.1 ABC-type multidrug transport system permease component [Glaucocystis incrassata]